MSFNQNKPEDLVKWEGDPLTWITSLDTRGRAVEIVGYSPEEGAVYYKQIEESEIDNHGDDEYRGEGRSAWDGYDEENGQPLENVIEQYWYDPEDRAIWAATDAIKDAYLNSGLSAGQVTLAVHEALEGFEGAIRGKARVSPIESGEGV
jgi:hypothetical protein